MSAGFVLLALAVCRRLLPAHWMAPAATVLAGIFNLPQVEIEPWPYALMASVALNGILVLAFQRFGLTGSPSRKTASTMRNSGRVKLIATTSARAMWVSA